MKYIFISPPLAGDRKQEQPEIRLVKLVRTRSGHLVLSEIVASCVNEQLITMGRGKCDLYLDQSPESRN